MSSDGICYRYALQNYNSFKNEVAEKFCYCPVITGRITLLIPYGRISCITVQGRSKRKQHFLGEKSKFTIVRISISLKGMSENTSSAEVGFQNTANN